jgi:hypothetical protein
MGEPEHIRGFTVTALQYLRSQVQFIAFTLKSRPDGTQGRIRTGRCRQHRARPEGSHSEVAYFEPSLARDENVGWLQVQVDHPSIMNEVKTLEQRDSQLGSRPTKGTFRPEGSWLGRQSHKPIRDKSERSRTYVAQISDNLPHPRFVQPGESASVLPEEMSHVAKLAQLRLNVQSLVLFPAVNVRQHVRVSGAWAKRHRMCIRQMLEDLDLFAQSKPPKR